MAWAANRREICGEVSTLTLTSFTRPARSRASCSSAGLTARHGPHHGAHRSTMTGIVAASATSPKVAGDTGVAGARGAASSVRGLEPDGKRKRYKGSGRTKQDVIEALKKGEELDAGLSTSRPYKVEAAAHDWLEHGLPTGAHAEGS